MALGRVRRYGTRRWRNRMTAKRIIVLCAALVVFCFGLGLLPDDVYAQGDSASSTSNDSGLPTVQGLARRNLNEDEDEDKGAPPTKVQMALGVGSFIIMIIVVKWL